MMPPYMLFKMDQMLNNFHIIGSLDPSLISKRKLNKEIHSEFCPEISLEHPHLFSCITSYKCESTPSCALPYKSIFVHPIVRKNIIFYWYECIYGTYLYLFMYCICNKGMKGFQSILRVKLFKCGHLHRTMRGPRTWLCPANQPSSYNIRCRDVTLTSLCKIQEVRKTNSKYDCNYMVKTKFKLHIYKL